MGKPASIERERDTDDELDGAEAPAARGYDAGDKGQVRERELSAKQVEQLRVAGFGEALRTKQGRAWMWWLLGECGVFRTSFTGNSTTFFNEGRRAIGLAILADFTRDFPDLYSTMTKENAHG